MVGQLNSTLWPFIPLPLVPIFRYSSLFEIWTCPWTLPDTAVGVTALDPEEERELV